MQFAIIAMRFLRSSVKYPVETILSQFERQKKVVSARSQPWEGNSIRSQMSRLTLTLLLALLGLTTSWATVPKIFVVQLKESTEKYPEYKSLDLDSYMASALDEIGQVDPIVWSVSDTRFRQICDLHKFPPELEHPSQSEIVRVSKAVDAEYTLVVWSVRNDSTVRPVATLYRGNGFKKVWTFGDWERRMAPFFVGETKPMNESDLRSFQSTYGAEILEFGAVMVSDQVDWDSTSRTITRTFAHLLKQGPLKDLPATPKQILPEADPGETVSIPNGVEVPQGGLVQVESLVLEGRTDLAIVQLRDMIDQEPFEDSYRLRLTELLEKEGLFIEAAREAIRGGQVGKKPLPFYQIAARNWLRAGILEQAREALNNVLARGGEDKMTRYMLGQYYLRTGDYDQAIEWYTLAIKNGPTPEIVYERAVAYAFSGQFDLCRDNLGSLVDVPADKLELSYAMVVLLCEEKLESISIRLRDRIPLLRVNRTDQSLVALSVKDQELAKNLAGLLELTPVPNRYRISHERRVLAHKLIQQSATEVFEFATTRNEELATEGTMSLREALKLIPEIRTLFEADQKR